MLKSLYIKNYALIDSLEINFQKGFSVITGETGAGKSIILGALSLILGQRADIKAIKQGENKCIIEGVFDVSAYDLRSFCLERGIEYDDSCILRREVLSSGKSRAFINDSPVTLNDLKDLGNGLIDVHSQHQNLLLANNHFQMQVVDLLAGTTDLLKEYQAVFNDYKHCQRSLTDLQEAIQKSREEEDYLRFQYEALREASLSEGEQENLESELETLNHAEDIKSALYKVYQLLSDDERGVVAFLKESLNTSHSLAKIYSKADEISQRLESSYLDLKDLASELQRLVEDVEFNPERLAFIESRLDVIYSLQKKHRLSTVAELISLYSELESQIQQIESFDQQLAELEKELSVKEQQARKLASNLSAKRRSAVKSIESALVGKLAFLGMPNTRFECKLIEREEMDANGIDGLDFLFSANKNANLQPVASIASGGEISRLMLCLKSMIAGAVALPTIIFDEIDTGVSGEIADKMGQVMLEFGQKMQVLAITHLPQIAAKGKTHYQVYKRDNEHATTTNLKQLSDQERLNEIARMLSGEQITDAALENARVMLGK